ncbi:LPS export ABC transporter permease LptF [Natronospira bacteriovora]|uniref:Lipopolysaccharide export system permease protein LptF n=1 Tax=Natronospira bacteriovora TaxID=3069753 RepID=A0ABU0W5X6_9GAMM|nr:LPS export ABC transporter permease LptF [Natronospira sp. AB-CW4]MDQ2069409.1 LPS export ABC transporter permease LptF [Natronospira sp. AB-CW4]
MQTVIERYINREVLLNWIGVTGALLIILMSHRFARFLGQAASGDIPADAIWSLMGLSTVQYLVILVPIAFFLGVLLALGRLYKDSEMAAMMACGVGPLKLYRALAWIALPIMFLVAWLSLYGSPMASQAIHQVQQAAQAEARLGVFEPGAFRRLEGADGVFYAERREADLLRGVFIQAFDGDEEIVIRARRGRVETDAAGYRYLVLEEGYRYELQPGSRAMQRSRFERHGLQLPEAAEPGMSDRRDTRAVRELLASGTPEDMAEFHWRLAMPIGGLVLTILAVPLARISPRQGRYGRLFAGIIVYVLYSNLLATGQVWLEREQIPTWLGLWWVHALVLVAALLWLLRQNGGARRFLARPGEAAGT